MKFNPEEDEIIVKRKEIDFLRDLHKRVKPDSIFFTKVRSAMRGDDLSTEYYYIGDRESVLSDTIKVNNRLADDVNHKHALLSMAERDISDRNEIISENSRKIKELRIKLTIMTTIVIAIIIMILVL
jgi:hypothetical protein